MSYFYSYCFFIYAPFYWKLIPLYRYYISTGRMNICSRWNMKILWYRPLSIPLQIADWRIHLLWWLHSIYWLPENEKMIIQDKFPGPVIAHWAAICECVFKDISPQEALILRYSTKHNRVIEVVKVPGIWKQTHPPSSYSSSLDIRFQEMTATKM